MKSKVSSGLLYLVIGGLLFSGMMFFVVFITSSSAINKKPITKLLISPMPDPPRPYLPPLFGKATVSAASPVSVPLTETVVLETTPSSSISPEVLIPELIPTPTATSSAQ